MYVACNPTEYGGDAAACADTLRERYPDPRPCYGLLNQCGWRDTCMDLYGCVQALVTEDYDCNPAEQ